MLGARLAVDVEKVHGVVARSTFGSEHVANTAGSGHFLSVEMFRSDSIRSDQIRLEQIDT